MASIRITLLALAVLATCMVANAQHRAQTLEEYNRLKAEYDRKKAVYDEFQTLTKVPVVGGYDLIPKSKEAESKPGLAEQLLPTYTGIPVKFSSGGPAVVSRGNTAGDVTTSTRLSTDDFAQSQSALFFGQGAADVRSAAPAPASVFKPAIAPPAGVRVHPPAVQLFNAPPPVTFVRQPSTTFSRFASPQRQFPRTFQQ